MLGLSRVQFETKICFVCLTFGNVDLWNGAKLITILAGIVWQIAASAQGNCVDDVNTVAT